jgi:hypothetical protein
LQTVVWGAVLALAAWVLWLGWLWSPVRQAELHTQNLLDRASRRDWEAVREMMASDYRDAWGHEKEQALRDAEEFGRHFFSLRIGPVEPLTVQSEEGTPTVSTRLGVYGSGTPMAHAIIEAVHELEKPFVFRWRKSGSWPWQWTLSGFEQEELVARYPR